jgi:hypothetical protein
MRTLLAGLFVAGVTLATFHPASATTACTTYASSNSNGTTTFPGTYVGAAGTASGQTCQIGDLADYNVSGSGGAFVNTANNPSIYSFYWGGGALTIAEQIGNNGIGDAIDVELDTLASQTSTSRSSVLASINIPFSSGPSGAYDLISDTNLAAGYYAIDTYLATGNVQDPTFQINFSQPVPEPATLALLAGPMLAVCARRRARR